MECPVLREVVERVGIEIPRRIGGQAGKGPLHACDGAAERLAAPDADRWPNAGFTIRAGRGLEVDPAVSAYADGGR